MQEKKPYYLDAINAFWKIPESDYLNGNEIALYFVLLKEFNRFGWKKDRIGISNNLLAEKISVSEKTLIQVRNKLKQIGAIDFIKGKKGRLTEYILLTIDWNNSSTNYSQKDITCNNSSTNYSTKVSTNSSTNFSHHKSIRLKIKDNTNNKENFSKNNFEEENFSETENFEKPTEEKISKPPAETEIPPSKKVAPKKVSQKTQESQVDALELPFESEEFQENWKDFRQVRKEMKKPVTPTAAKMIFKKLKPFGEKIAIKSLEDSISNNWQGVFPKNDDQERSYSAPKNTTQNIKPDFINADYSNTSLG